MAESKDIREACIKCQSRNLLNYYIKPYGEVDLEYWRCNECLTIIEVTVEPETRRIIDWRVC